MSHLDQDGYGIETLSRDMAVSRETADRREAIIGLLGEWRLKFNLIGPNEYHRIWRRHVLDSVELLPILPQDKKIVDLGSGAGFPGLIIAASLAETGGHVTMIESVGKKRELALVPMKCAGLPAPLAGSRLF